MCGNARVQVQRGHHGGSPTVGSPGPQGGQQGCVSVCDLRWPKPKGRSSLPLTTDSSLAPRPVVVESLWEATQLPCPGFNMLLCGGVRRSNLPSLLHRVPRGGDGVGRGGHQAGSWVRGGLWAGVSWGCLRATAEQGAKAAHQELERFWTPVLQMLAALAFLFEAEGRSVKGLCRLKWQDPQPATCPQWMCMVN